MQNLRKIKVEVDGFTIHIDEENYHIEKNGLFVEGMIEELGVSQKVWLDNTHACMISFVNSLNFDNSVGI